MTLGRLGGLVAAVVLVAVGLRWTLQGFDVIGGSAMSGQAMWAIIGPITAGLGVALGIVVVQRIRSPRPDDGLDGRYGG